MISSSLMSFKLCAVAATALVCDDESRFWRRAECLRPGRFRVNANSAPYVDHGGEGSFSSYRDGTWHNRTADGAWTYALRGASAGCAIQPLSLELLTSVLRGVRGARAGDAGDAAVRARDGPHRRERVEYRGSGRFLGLEHLPAQSTAMQGIRAASREARYAPLRTRAAGEILVAAGTTDRGRHPGEEHCFLKVHTLPRPRSWPSGCCRPP